MRQVGSQRVCAGGDGPKSCRIPVLCDIHAASGLRPWIAARPHGCVCPVGFKPFSCSGLLLTDFSGVLLLLALEEPGKFTNVLGNSLSS